MGLLSNIRDGNFTSSEIIALLSTVSRPMTDDELKQHLIEFPKSKKKNIDSAFQGTPIDFKGAFESAVRDEIITNTQFAIEQAFYYLVYIATSERNPYISGSFVTFAQQLLKDSNNDIEQIGGEGLPDFHLGEHIDTER